jgi:hypothetical protein
MSPDSPAQQLLVAIEAATTERQFASALADYRAPRNEDGRRIKRKGMPSLSKLQACRDLPARSQISEWENADRKSKFKRFTEKQLHAYLHECHIAGGLFEACIGHYRRITQQSPADQVVAPANIEPSQPGLAAKATLSNSLHVVDEIYAELANILNYTDPSQKPADPLWWKVTRIPRMGPYGELFSFLALASRAAASIGGKIGNALLILLEIAKGAPRSLAERERIVMKILEVEPSLFYSDRHDHELLSKLASEMYKIYVTENYYPGCRFSIYGDWIKNS